MLYYSLVFYLYFTIGINFEKDKFILSIYYFKRETNDNNQERENLLFHEQFIKKRR